MPDSIESRLARLEQRVEDHENDIRLFAPLVPSMAVLQEQMTQFRKDVGGILERMEARERALQAREDARTDFSTKRLVAFVAGSAAVIAAVITAVATIITHAP